MNFKYLLKGLVVFLSFSVFSQVNELPIHFGLYFNDPQINPAKAGSDANTEFYIGSKRNQNDFGGIKTSYASIFFRLKENKGSFHSIGVCANSDKEGPVITRNRVYLLYSRHQKINSQYTLSAGLSSGYYNFLIKANPITGGASSGVVDFNLGVYLYTKTSSLGLSVNQINGGKVQPLYQVIKLVPQYSILANHTFKINPKIQFNPSCFLRYAQLYHTDLNVRAGVAITTLLSNIIHIGGSYEYKEGEYVFFGIHNLTLESPFKSNNYGHIFNLDFSYFLPNISNNRTNINSYELTIRYFIKKNK